MAFGAVLAARPRLERFEGVAEESVARALVREVHRERRRGGGAFLRRRRIPRGRNVETRRFDGAFGSRPVPPRAFPGRFAHAGVRAGALGRRLARELQDRGSDRGLVRGDGEVSDVAHVQELDDRGGEQRALQAALGDVRVPDAVVFEPADVRDREEHQGERGDARELALGLHQEHRRGHDEDDDEQDREVELEGVAVPETHGRRLSWDERGRSRASSARLETADAPRRATRPTEGATRLASGRARLRRERSRARARRTRAEDAARRARVVCLARRAFFVGRVRRNGRRIRGPRTLGGRERANSSARVLAET